VKILVCDGDFTNFMYLVRFSTSSDIKLIDEVDVDEVNVVRRGLHLRMKVCGVGSDMHRV